MKNDRDFLTFLKGRFKGRITLLFILALSLLVLLLVFSENAGSEGEPVKDGEEERIEALCSSVSGVGECRVMVTYEKNEGKNGEKTVCSVAVVCEGADNIEVRARVVELITSLYGIGANRVSVIRLRK